MFLVLFSKMFGAQKEDVITGLLLGLVLGLGFGLTVACDYGFNAFIKHFLLRYILYQQGNIPWDLVPFLDHAAECILLRKVGGGYIFIHRMLMDYFAELDSK